MLPQKMTRLCLTTLLLTTACTAETGALGPSIDGGDVGLAQLQAQLAALQAQVGTYRLERDWGRNVHASRYGMERVAPTQSTTQRPG